VAQPRLGEDLLHQRYRVHSEMINVSLPLSYGGHDSDGHKSGEIRMLEE
jgi:hypothetical protein